MNRFVLDTSALLTLRDDEPGAERVAEVLGLALEGKAKCFACFISLKKLKPVCVKRGLIFLSVRPSVRLMSLCRSL